MYTLMALLGLLATGGFIHGFVYRRRRYLILFVDLPGADALHARVGDLLRRRRRGRADPGLRSTPRTGGACCATPMLSFGAAAVLFLPWLPTLLYQATHTGSPWDTAPNFGAPVQISRNLMGGDRATTALVLGAAIGLASLLDARAPAHPRGDDDVGADPDPDRDARVRLDRVALLAGLAVPLLRADPRPRCCCSPLGPGASQGRRPDRARAGRDLLGQSGVLHAAVQERHARRRRRDGAAAAPGRSGRSSASPSRCRSPGTTCPAGLRFADTTGARARTRSR